MLSPHFLHSYQVRNNTTKYILFQIFLPMLENSTSNNDLIERRCVLIKENGDLEEVKVCLANKEAVKELLGGDAEFKGEMEDQHIAILGFVFSFGNH